MEINRLKIQPWPPKEDLVFLFQQVFQRVWLLLTRTQSVTGHKNTRILLLRIIQEHFLKSSKFGKDKYWTVCSSYKFDIVGEQNLYGVGLNQSVLIWVKYFTFILSIIIGQC